MKILNENKINTLCISSFRHFLVLIGKLKLIDDVESISNKNIVKELRMNCIFNQFNRDAIDTIVRLISFFCQRIMPG
jgi:hypothetical protein